MNTQCPRCDSFRTIKRGTRNDKQRLKCLDCGKWFSIGSQRSSKAKILIFDIETAQMQFKGWQLKQNGYIPHHRIVKDWFIICWCAKWLYDSEIIGECITPKEAKKRNDKRIVSPIWNLLNQADIIIGHNVKNFDLKKLNARFLDHGFTSPPLPYIVLDTLLQSRNVFDYSSHKLDYITKFLKLPNKLNTEIGLWDRCEDGEQESLDRMFKYCGNDVMINEEVYLLERAWMKNHPNIALYGDMEEKRCPYCTSTNLTKQGRYVTPMNVYDSYRCECGGISRAKNNRLTIDQRNNLIRSVAK